MSKKRRNRKNKRNSYCDEDLIRQKTKDYKMRKRKLRENGE